MMVFHDCATEWKERNSTMKKEYSTHIAMDRMKYLHYAFVLCKYFPITSTVQASSQ